MIKYPLRADGIFTRVWEAGESSQTAVLVHEASLRLDWWRLNMKVLADAGVRTLLMDLPGHGFADKPTDGEFTVASFTRFLNGFLDAAEIQRPILVGSGLGGHIVANLACEHPEKVGGLVLSSPTGIAPIGAEGRAALVGLLGDTSRDGAEARARTLVNDPSLYDADWLEDEYRINDSPGAREAFDALSRYIELRLDADLLGERLARVVSTVPTRVVWGTEDRVLPISLLSQVQEALGQRVPVTVIEGASHAPYFDYADAFNAAVLQTSAEVNACVR